MTTDDDKERLGITRKMLKTCFREEGERLLPGFNSYVDHAPFLFEMAGILLERDRARDALNKKAWEWEVFGPVAKEEYFREANLPEKEKEKNWQIEVDGKEHILHEIYFRRIRAALGVAKEG